MSEQHPDYTEDDFNIVSLGYWDPDEDEENEPAPSEAEHRPEPPAQAEAEAAVLSPQEQEKEAEPQAAEENPWDEAYLPASLEEGEDKAPDIARVELVPGGVKAALEAILAVAQAPVSTRELSATLFVPERTIEAALDQLYREYRGYDDGERVHEPRGFDLRRVAGGWRLYARADFSPWVAQHVKSKESAKLPKSAMETLSVIAYQQPVSKAHVAAIRGANSDAAFRTLLLHGLITESTPDEDGTAQFSTTGLFLEKMGLNSLAELPPLAPYLPDIDEVSLLGEEP